MSFSICGEPAVADLRGFFPIALAGGQFFVLAQLLLLLLEVAHVVDGGFLAVPPLFQDGGFAAQTFQFVLDVAEPLLRGGIAFEPQRLALDFEMRNAAILLVDFDGHGADLQTQRRAGFVDQVDGFIGQETVGDIAMRKQGRRHDGGIFNAHAVMDLEFFLKAAQNGDGVVDSRFAYEDGLEAARQCGVFFDVLVFGEGGRADAAQIAAGQRGLQHVGGVDGAFRGACAHQRMQFVDEADDFAVRVGDLLEHGFQTVFELTAELGAGHHGAEIDRDQFLVAQLIGDVALHDALGEAFDDGGLCLRRVRRSAPGCSWCGGSRPASGGGFRLRGR